MRLGKRGRWDEMDRAYRRETGQGIGGSHQEGRGDGSIRKGRWESETGVWLRERNREVTLSRKCGALEKEGPEREEERRKSERGGGGWTE